MANPTSDSYAAASGAVIYAGRAAPGPVGPPPPTDTTAMAAGALLGQSNMQNPFSSSQFWPLGSPNALAYLSGALRRIGNIKDSSPPGSLYPSQYSSGYTTGDALVDGDALVFLGNDLAAAVGGAIRLYPAAIGGTAISSWLTGGGSWTAYAADVAASAVLPRWAIWLQGESNAGGDSATYANNLAAVQAQLVAQSGRAASAYGFAVVPLGPCVPGPNGGSSWTPEGNFGALRAVQLAHAASATGAYLINATLDATLADIVHYNTASYVRVFRRYAEWVRRWAAGNGGQLAGPRITGATRSGAVITVTIAHAGGSALLDGAGGTGSALAGFRVYDAGTPVTISSTSIVNATTVTLTLASTPAGTVTMDFGMANLPFGSGAPAASSILYDNTTVANDTVGIPLQPRAAFTVS